VKAKETWRIVPVAWWAAAACAVLLVAQAWVAAGGMETSASAVRRYAPWAYGPFLKLVGEHPSSRRADTAAAAERAGGAASPSVMATVAGFSPDALSVVIDTGPGPATNAAPEPAVQDKPLPEPEAAPVVPPPEPEPVG